MIAALLLIAAQTAPPISVPQAAAIQEVLKPWRTDTGPGGVVGIYKDGQVVFSAGLGLADMEQGTKLTPESMMDIGSISKQFVAAAVIRLQEEGKLSLDDSVRKHLPQLPEFMEEIKLHHLMHHTSGLRDYLNLTLLANADLSSMPTITQMLAMMSKQKELNFPVGKGTMYCNTGYAMLAEIVKRTEKTDLTTAVKRLVWTPLDMNSSVFDESIGLVVPRRANSYVRTADGYGASRIRVEIVGDGGVLTTVADMAKWAAFLQKPKPEFSSWQALMIKPSPTPMTANMRYASGLFLDSLSGVKRIQHAGDWSGFHAQFSLYPDSGWAVFTSGNDGTQLSKIMNDAIARILLGLAEPAATASQPSESGGPLTASDIKAFSGQYVLEPIKLPITFRVENGVLLGSPEGQGTVPLARVSRLEFRFEAAGATFVFDEPKDGISGSVTLKQGGVTYNGPRGATYAASSEILDRWEGTYHSDELGYDIVITREGESLSLRINGNEWGAGRLASDTRLTAGGFITIDTEGEATPFSAIRVDAGGRASRLLFTRVAD